jgi:UDP-3-O-[3-hydroxymyristoyl] N-acetylglucosamine deacetylase/3-hydroxyacyl-[acyl-carrier-protein] dehydratase
MNQKTISKSVQLHGVGLHTGKEVKLVFQPAPANHGIKFQRVDIEESPVLSADVNKVISTNRGTTIKQGNTQVSTIEHALSAIVGVGVDNVLIEIDGPEVPIMDGSAMPFVEKILEAGILELDEPREYFEVLEPISYKDEVTGTELLALPSEVFEVTAMIDFNSPVVGQQYASLSRIEDYAVEIAPCRTFVFLRELDQLLNQNLIKGGDLENAIVIVDRLMDQEELDKLARKLNKTDIKVEKEGILNTIDLHFKNEPARHKLLDIIGDLALIGKPIKGKIVATKPGHTANVEFAKLLKKKMIEQRKLRGKPKIDFNQEPLMDVTKIKKLLPHRFPMLLVDQVLEMTDNHVVGVKAITYNEPIFQGHFPNQPLFPGVLQIEALAQVGGVLILSQVPDPENWSTYFVKIDNVKFKNMVRPGDTLILKMELISPVRRGICHMYGTAYIGNKIACEGELTAQIVKTNHES